jgi:hypothetical protein
MRQIDHRPANGRLLPLSPKAPGTAFCPASCLTLPVRLNLDSYSCDVGQNVVTEIGYKYNGLWLAVLLYQLAGVSGGR